MGHLVSMNWSGTKSVRVFLTVIILFSVVNLGVMIIREIKGLNEHQSDFERRYYIALEPIIDALSPNTTIEYQGDDINSYRAISSLHMMQYVLAPRIVTKGKRSRYIILHITDPLKRNGVIQAEGLKIIQRIDDEIFFCERFGE
jgi:hypothetical protein